MHFQVKRMSLMYMTCSINRGKSSRIFINAEVLILSFQNYFYFFRFISSKKKVFSINFPSVLLFKHFSRNSTFRIAILKVSEILLFAAISMTMCVGRTSVNNREIEVNKKILKSKLRFTLRYWITFGKSRGIAKMSSQSRRPGWLIRRAHNPI